MKSKTLKLILATGLALFPAASLRASVNSVLNLDLKCYIQEGTSVRGDINAGKVSTIRITSKNLLRLAGEQLGVRFPGGSQLKVTVDGKVVVEDVAGRAVSDVSQLFKAKLEVDDRLYNGRANRATNVENTTNYYPITLTINLTNLKGTFRGIVIENFNVTAPDRFGIQRVTSDGMSTVNGKGFLNGAVAYYDGSLKLTGRTGIVNAQ